MHGCVEDRDLRTHEASRFDQVFGLPASRDNPIPASWFPEKLLSPGQNLSFMSSSEQIFGRQLTFNSRDQYGSL
jgi:hypothetical protein